MFVLFGEMHLPVGLQDDSEKHTAAFSAQTYTHLTEQTLMQNAIEIGVAGLTQDIQHQQLMWLGNKYVFLVD